MITTLNRDDEPERDPRTHVLRRLRHLLHARQTEVPRTVAALTALLRRRRTDG